MTGTLKDLTHVSLDEIIFEGRNQEYGAFQLRQLYASHLKQAAALATALLLLLFTLPHLVRRLDQAPVAPPKPAPEAHWTTIQTVPPPLFVPPVTPAQAAPPATLRQNTTQFVPPRVVADATPTPEPLTTMQQANEALALGATTVTDGRDTLPAPVVAPLTGPAAPEAAPSVWEYVEQPAEFPGGYKALQDFVAHHTKYPALAMRNQVEGRVYVRFVVDETGRVQAATLLKGIGGGCDEEALRVVQALPRFTPGRQNGKPVKVYFSLPINFQYQ